MIGDQTFETARGRRNRVAIGRPSWRLEDRHSKGSLSRPGDLEDFPPDAYALHRLELALTLMPDEGCRFRSADLILRTRDDPDEDGPPLVLRLDPERITTEKILEVTTTTSASIGAKPLAVLSADIERSRVRREELTAVEVGLEGFGERSAEAGWRFRITGRGEVPLTSLYGEAWRSHPLPRLVGEPRGHPCPADHTLRTTPDGVSIFGGPIGAIPGSGDPTFRLQAALVSGALRDDGTTRLHGQTVLKFTGALSGLSSSTVTYYAQPTSLLPIRVEWTTGQDPADNTLNSVDFSVAERLPTTPENLARLDVATQRPDAHVIAAIGAATPCR